MFSTNKFKPIINNIELNANLSYYKYFDPYTTNHYNLINKLEKYKSLSSCYLSKYPNSSVWINSNDDFFDKNPDAKNEFHSCVSQQSVIKKEILSDIEFLCSKNKNCDICTDFFQSFYIKHNYHIDQNIDGVINYLKKDIINNELNIK